MRSYNTVKKIKKNHKAQGSIIKYQIMKVKNELIRVNLINSHPGSPCIEKSEKIHKDNLMPIEKIEKKIKQIQSTPVNSTNPWLEIWNMDNPVKEKKTEQIMKFKAQ